MDKSFQDNLLSTINTYVDSTNIKVVSFENPHVFVQEGTENLTYSFTLQVNFNRITQLIYQLEKQFKLGKIISVNYIKKRNFEYAQIIWSAGSYCSVLLVNFN